MTWDVIEGDCLEVMAGMADASVDAIVTDPPYGTGHWKRPIAGAGSDPSGHYQRAEWDTFSLSWLPDALRVSRGPVLTFIPQTRLPEMFDYCAGLNVPWRLLIWAKSDPKPRPAGQVAWGTEPIVALRGLRAAGGKDWFAASAPRLNRDREAVGHPHQKPVSLMSWLCALACPAGGTILDPFAGSGTTGVAALLEGFEFVGIEQHPPYAALARQRLLSASGANLPLFAAAL